MPVLVKEVVVIGICEFVWVACKTCRGSNLDLFIHAVEWVFLNASSIVKVQGSAF